MKNIGGSRHIGSLLDPDDELMPNSTTGRLSSSRSRHLSKIAKAKNPLLGRCLQLKSRIKVNDRYPTGIWKGGVSLRPMTANMSPIEDSDSGKSFVYRLLYLARSIQLTSQESVSHEHDPQNA